jgi:hypothetical protein
MTLRNVVYYILFHTVQGPKNRIIIKTEAPEIPKPET